MVTALFHWEKKYPIFTSKLHTDPDKLAVKAHALKCPIPADRLDKYLKPLEWMLESEQGGGKSKWLPRCENKHIMKAVKKPVPRDIRGKKFHGESVSCDICRASIITKNTTYYNCESGKCDMDLCTTCVDKMVRYKEYLQKKKAMEDEEKADEWKKIIAAKEKERENAKKLKA